MIYLLWPTARPEVFKKTYAEWIKKADRPEFITTLVAVDNESHYTDLKAMQDGTLYVYICSNPNRGITEPLEAITFP